ncbi:hypothetical protein Slin15195_G039040 [Septoria linicola]|uniref:Uncharacterized protein n=1 Tax=Septoria linicola TaxID=215465 RepID=A0A9Q9AKA1_9PEZI|nr:hypothetical protein Slin14017_G120460 [Septoria linicola]USW50585.1 hypothetical protein Slin15195_G039040 [Septoria linicola]
MDPPAPFGDVQAANKLMEGALAGLFKGVNARCDALQMQHDHALKSSQADKKALRDSLDDLTEKYTSMSETNSKLMATHAELSTRLTSMQGGLGAIEQMATELGEQLAKYDIPALSEDMDRLKRQHNIMQAKMRHQQPFIDGILGLTAGFAGSQSPSLANLRTERMTVSGTLARESTPGTNKKLPILRQDPRYSFLLGGAESMEVDDIAQRPLRSAATFRAVSPDETELAELPALPQPSGHTDAVPTTSAVKRTASQRRSESSLDQDSDNQHKRSQSLQRKRAKSNLKKAGELQANDTPGASLAPKRSQLQHNFTASDIDNGNEGDFDDASSDIVVDHPRTKTVTHINSELSPASQDHLTDLAGGKSAADLFKTLAQNSNCARPQTSSRPLSFHADLAANPLPGSQNAFASQQPARDMMPTEPILTSIDASLPGLANDFKAEIDIQRPASTAPAVSTLTLNGAQPTTSNRRHSARETKKKPIPEGFIDVRTLQNDKKAGLVPKRVSVIEDGGS